MSGSSAVLRKGGVLTLDLLDFCQSGLSVVLGSCDASGRPVVGHGLACRRDGSAALRVVLRQPSNLSLLQAVQTGAWLAVTFTKPSTDRSIQLKAAGATIGPCDPTDLQQATAQSAVLAAELVDVGYTEALARRYCAFEPEELLALVFVPLQAFVQTPGPGAGSPLKP